MTVRLQKQDFDVTTELNLMRGDRSDIGATVSFVGYVRDTANGIKIRSMTLEHYPAMAQLQLEKIETQAHSRWLIDDCLIIHRFGVLKPAEQIVMVITCSPHRAAAFEACDYIMDFLKTDAPFWKKENPVSGSADWVKSKLDDDEAKARWN